MTAEYFRQTLLLLIAVGIYCRQCGASCGFFLIWRYGQLGAECLLHNFLQRPVFSQSVSGAGQTDGAGPHGDIPPAKVIELSSDSLQHSVNQMYRGEVMCINSLYGAAHIRISPGAAELGMNCDRIIRLWKFRQNAVDSRIAGLAYLSGHQLYC